MMFHTRKPIYLRNWLCLMDDYLQNRKGFLELETTTPWEQRVEARKECFMSDPIRTYTYGKERGERTYTSVPYSSIVQQIITQVNLWTMGDTPLSFNAVFLNRYENERQALGWHSDDSPGQDHNHPIIVFTAGQPREIWWRPIGYTGVIPQEWKQLLEPGSLFVMPGGMQQTHQHRIPKGGRAMGTRISLTFRKFL